MEQTCLLGLSYLLDPTSDGQMANVLAGTTSPWMCHSARAGPPLVARLSALGPSSSPVHFPMGSLRQSTERQLVSIPPIVGERTPFVAAPQRRAQPFVSVTRPAVRENPSQTNAQPWPAMLLAETLLSSVCDLRSLGCPWSSPCVQAYSSSGRGNTLLLQSDVPCAIKISSRLTPIERAGNGMNALRSPRKPFRVAPLAGST